MATTLFFGVNIPTVYVNDLGYRREYKSGGWYSIYTTGNGNDSDASPCDYGYTLTIAESSIVNKEGMGICRSGGRAWKITYSGGVTAPVRINAEFPGGNLTLPENVRSFFVGNGHLIWCVSADGRASSIAFVPLLDNANTDSRPPPKDPNPDPGDPNPDPGDPNPDPGDPNPDPGDPNPDPGDQNPSNVKSN